MRLPVMIALVCALAVPAAGQTIALPDGHEFNQPERYPFALSPDGTQLLYTARATLFLRPVAGGVPALVEGPLRGRNQSNPAFSPDGRSIVYWTNAGGVIERVSAAGGMRVSLATVDSPLGLSWGTDSRIYIGGGDKGVLRVPASGGPLQTVVTLAAGEAARGPQLLPDGDHVLFTLGEGTPTNWAQSRIVVQSMTTRQRTVITPGGDARYLASGNLLYVSGGRVMAVRFDARTRSVSGQPRAISDSVQIVESTGAALVAVAANGALAYVRAAGPAVTQLGLVSLDGKRTLLGPVPAGTAAPRIAANGKKVAFAAQGTIYVADFPNIASARKVIENATFPLLSPDGEWLSFGSLGQRRNNGEEILFMQRADGSGEPEIVARPARAGEHWMEGDQGFSFISHRGRGNNYDVWFYAPGKKEVEPIALSLDDSAQMSSSMSPNRKWVAFMSSESGDWQLYIQPYPATGKKYQVSTQGGRSPMWTSDNQLVFDKDGQMYAVSVQLGDTPTFGQPKTLPVTGYIQPQLRRNWELIRAGDASQFLMLFRPAPQIQVTSNWQN
jgi:Tol biopolymer transport system component